MSVVYPGVTNTAIAEHTRFVGRRDDPMVRARTAGLFQHGHPPSKVAAAIVDAVDRDRAVVFVGWEARAAWMLQRAAPVSLQQRLATLFTESARPGDRDVVKRTTSSSAKLPIRNPPLGGSS